MRTRRVMAAVMALVLLGLAGCARPKETEKPTPGGRLVIGLLRAPAGQLRPPMSDEAAAAPILGLLYSGLLRPGAGLAPVCDLCATFSVAPDQRSITFKLRSDVKWHDGKPFTSADVRATFEAMLTPGYAGAQAGKLAALTGVQALLDGRDAIDRAVAAGQVTSAGAKAQKADAWERWLAGPGRQAIQAVDPLTVTFTLDQPYAPLLTALMSPILPAHTTGPIGTGPFRFVREGLLARYEGYHFGVPLVAEVAYQVVPPGKGLAMLQAGQVDYAPLQPAEAGRVAADDAGVRIIAWPASGYQYLGVNQRRPPFDDVRVRQALMYGIDRAGLVRQLLGGRGTVVNTHVLPGHWADVGDGRNAYAYDPGKAVALLTEAGWGKVDTGGYRVKAGQRFRFTLLYPRGNQVREKSATMIQRDLQAIGIQVDLQMVEFAQLVREVFGQRQTDAWLLGWDLGVDPDPGPIFSHGNKWGEAAGWTSAESEALLAQGRGRLSLDERRPVYAQWAKLVNAELPYIFMYAEQSVAGVRSQRVRGLAPDVRGPLWNLWQWWIPTQMQ